MVPQIKINMTCDEGRVADSLRYLANIIEEYDGEGYPEEVETYDFFAEITEE